MPDSIKETIESLGEESRDASECQDNPVNNACFHVLSEVVRSGSKCFMLNQPEFSSDLVKISSGLSNQPTQKLELTVGACCSDNVSSNSYCNTPFTSTMTTTSNSNMETNLTAADTGEEFLPQLIHHNNLTSDSEDEDEEDDWMEVIQRRRQAATSLFATSPDQ